MSEKQPLQSDADRCRAYRCACESFRAHESYDVITVQDVTGVPVLGRIELRNA